MTKNGEDRRPIADTRDANRRPTAWWLAVAAIVLGVAVVAGVLWWLAGRAKDPRTEAAFIAGGTSLLVAAVGVLSTTTGVSVSHRNAVRLFERQFTAQQNTQFDGVRRAACERLVGVARLHALAAADLEDAIQGSDKDLIDTERASERALRTELVQQWATVNLLADTEDLRQKADALAKAGLMGTVGEVDEVREAFEEEARQALGIPGNSPTSIR